MVWALLAGFVALLVVLGLGGTPGSGRRRRRPGMSRATMTRVALWSLAALAVVAALLLAVTGRWPAVVAVAAASLPVVLRLAGTALKLAPVYHLLRRARSANPPGGGFGQAGRAQARPKTVETASLRMTLDPDTGAMTGVILTGPDRGRALADLPPDRLRHWLNDWRINDPDAARLLETWGERMIGPGWAEDPTGRAGDGTGDGGGGGGGGGGQAGPPPSDEAMTTAEARAILDVAADASPADIHAAWRRMMARVHPDQGGSAALAARVNAARDRLTRPASGA